MANLFPSRASCRIRTNDPEITNHVLWPTELKRRVGKQSISRRYDLIPLLRSGPGGFKGSWPYRTYPFCGCKVSANRTKKQIYFSFSEAQPHFLLKKYKELRSNRTRKNKFRLPDRVKSGPFRLLGNPTQLYSFEVFMRHIYYLSLFKFLTIIVATPHLTRTDKIGKIHCKHRQ